MIDSISLRLHDSNLKGHDEIFDLCFFNSKANAQLAGIEHDFVSYRSLIKSGNLMMKTFDVINDELYYCDTEKTVKFINGRIPSSNHYDCGFRLNPERDSIDFSFSIPKWVYGHNIAQFIPNPHLINPNFLGIGATVKEIAVNGYDRLIGFIRQFFSETFVNMPVHFSHVEIIRIDMCFNQYFHTKENALTYLDLMYKQVHVHGSKMAESEIKLTPEKNKGLISVGKNHYYKIYHKGWEFDTVGDKRELDKQNRMNEKNLKLSKLHNMKFNPHVKTWDIEVLQMQADRILRHEARFFPGNMSYFFKRHVYKKEHKGWNIERDHHRNLKAKQMRFNRDPEKNKADQLEKSEWEWLKAFEKKLNQRHRFYLEGSNNMIQDQSSKSDLELHGVDQFFSRRLYNMLYKKFWEYVQNSQVTAMQTDELINMKINLHNERIEKRIQQIKNKYTDIIDQERMKKALQLKKITPSIAQKVLDGIEKYGSLHRWLSEGKISRSTLYRYKRLLKIIEMSASINTGPPITTDISYRRYFESIMMNRKVESAFFQNTTTANKSKY